MTHTCVCIDGRRPVYILSLACQCLGSIGVANARSVRMLLFFRVCQALGSSSGLSNGMGVIGDLYKLEERGTASGTYFGVRPLSLDMSRTLMRGSRVYSLSFSDLHLPRLRAELRPTTIPGVSCKDVYPFLPL